MIRLLATAALLLTAAAPAIAAPGDSAVRIRVRHADLNLSSPEGAARMARRIRYAARNACGVGTRGLAMLSSERLCRQELEAGAHRQLAMAVLPVPAVRIASAR